MDYSILNSVDSITFHYKKRSWEFPKEKFIQYDSKDENWCRYFKIGRDIVSSCSLRLNNVGVRSVTTDWLSNGLLITRLELISQ